jgi:hypothetical protein
MLAPACTIACLKSSPMCKIVNMNYSVLASELVRELRGRRSQAAFSRRLGYRSNIVHMWETGQRWPTASRFLWAAERAGRDVAGGIRRFFGDAAPAWLLKEAIGSSRFVGAIMDEMRGNTKLGTVAKQLGVSRFRVSRWLAGQTEPQLPFFLAFVEVTSLRLLDFIGAAIADPRHLPSIAHDWTELEAHRAVAYEQPWSQGVLRALELQDYQALPAHRPGWIARRIGISIEEEKRCLELLQKGGQIRTHADRYVPNRVMTVDIRRDPAASRALKQWWSKIAIDRLTQESPADLCYYNLFTVSEADLKRLKEMQAAYFEGIRAVIAASEPSERVALVNLQLFEIDKP